MIILFQDNEGQKIVKLFRAISRKETSGERSRVSTTDGFLFEFDEGQAAVPDNVTNIALELPTPGPNLHISPDKAVIQARGQGRIPLSFSPESDMSLQESDSSGSNAPIKTRVSGQKERKFVKTDFSDSTHCERTA